jgi:prevent-host-death family protein
MKRVSVSELKSSLSAYLAAVRKGEEVLVTDRGRPVARLVSAGESETASDRAKRLAREGVVQPASGRFARVLLQPSPAEDREGRVLAALLEERRAGR